MDSELKEILEIVKDSVDNDVYSSLLKFIITPKEIEFGNQLAMCYNAMLKLPEAHSHDAKEFVLHIHALQNMNLARVGLRQIGLFGKR